VLIRNQSLPEYGLLKLRRSIRVKGVKNSLPEFFQSKDIRDEIWTLGTKIRPKKPKYVQKVFQKQCPYV
jgi:hypothetical protein